MVFNNISFKKIIQMKQFLLSLSFFLLLTSFLQAQDIDVPQTHQPLITKRTASWCSNCGSWGWTLFEDLLSDNRSNALVIAAHHSGNYINDAATAITDNLGGFGQPTFFLNNDNQNANSGNGSTVRDNIRNQVLVINAAFPVVQAGIRAQMDDTYTLFIDTKVSFFQEEDGKYKLGVYLIDRSFIGSQTPIGNNAEHKNVIRLAATDDIFGEEIANGAITEGTTIESAYTIPGQLLEQEGLFGANGFDNERFEIATIIWKENVATQKYDVVNTNKTSIGILSAVNEIEALEAFTIQPTVANDQSIAFLSINNTIEQAQVRLLNNQGQVMRTLFRGELNEGDHRFDIIRNELPAGLYYVQLINQHGSTNTKRLIFK
jgi:hypothetical protein